MIFHHTNQIFIFRFMYVYHYEAAKILQLNCKEKNNLTRINYIFNTKYQYLGSEESRVDNINDPLRISL